MMNSKQGIIAAWCCIALLSCGLAPVEPSGESEQAFTFHQWTQQTAPPHLYQVSQNEEGLCGIDPSASMPWGYKLVCNTGSQGSYQSYGNGYAIDFYVGHPDVYTGEVHHAIATTNDGAVWSITTGGWTQWGGGAIALRYPGCAATWQDWYVIGNNENDPRLYMSPQPLEFFHEVPMPTVDGVLQRPYSITIGWDNEPVVLTEQNNVVGATAPANNGWQVLFHGTPTMTPMAVSPGDGSTTFNTDESLLTRGGMWMIAAQGPDQTYPLQVYQHVYHAATGHQWIARPLPGGRRVSDGPVLIASPLTRRVWTQSKDPNNLFGPWPIWAGN